MITRYCAVMWLALLLCCGTGNSRQSVLLPDPRLTPGDVLPANAYDVCGPGYGAGMRVPAAVAKRVFAAYGIKAGSKEYAVDFLVPPSLSGSNSARNLWPVPVRGKWGRDRKAALGLRLHTLVCGGRLDLEKAQREIACNWISAYMLFVWKQ